MAHHQKRWTAKEREERKVEFMTQLEGELISALRPFAELINAEDVDKHCVIPMLPPNIGDVKNARRLYERIQPLLPTMGDIQEIYRQTANP